MKMFVSDRGALGPSFGSECFIYSEVEDTIAISIQITDPLKNTFLIGKETSIWLSV